MTTQITRHSGNVLIVDDEVNIRTGLKAMLEKDGHTVREASSGEEALQLVRSFNCEAAIVDIRMPGMPGTQLLRELRRLRPHLAVIMLTGHGTLDTAVTAVQEGAHNYLLKPARPDDLRQGVQEAIRTTRREQREAQLIDTLRDSLKELETLPATSNVSYPATQSTLVVGDIRIDRLAHTVHYDQKPVALTPSEYSILLVLADRAGQVVDYQTLVRLGLDYDTEAWEAKELIKRHIFALRQKLEPDPASPRTIINVRGVGYRLSS